MTAKQISWSTLDVATRKASEFILAAHRHVREGCPIEGLHGGTWVRISAIELRKYLDEIIATENRQ